MPQTSTTKGGDGALVKVPGLPGIYRRHAKGCARTERCSCPYVIIYRGADAGQQRETFRTRAEAIEGKRLAARRVALAKAHVTGIHRERPEDDCPECERQRQQRQQAEPMLHEYAREWVETYQGTGRRGFRQETRDESRRLLERYALSYFPDPTRLTDIGPKQVDGFIGWLVKQPSRRGGTLTDRSIRNALGPLSACLATARRHGLIAHNPCTDATLPHRPRIEDDEDRPRPFPGAAMEQVVSLVNPDHRLMFELLAATGVRRSELLALEVRHLAVNGKSPVVKVRQRVRRRRGTGLVVGPPKSRHARRDLPLELPLARRLAAHVAGRDERELVFPSTVGTILDPDNVADRVLAPACAAAGVEWAGFHTFRHTVASRLFAEGRNVVQVQRWLGHHSPSFTLDTYVHLLDGDLGEPLTPLATNTTTNSRRKSPQTVPRPNPRKPAISRTNAEQPQTPKTPISDYGTEGREFESLRARYEESWASVLGVSLVMSAVTVSALAVPPVRGSGDPTELNARIVKRDRVATVSLPLRPRDRGLARQLADSSTLLLRATGTMASRSPLN